MDAQSAIGPVLFEAIQFGGGGGGFGVADPQQDLASTP
jgi:hypothetical protein